MNKNSYEFTVIVRNKKIVFNDCDIYDILKTSWTIQEYIAPNEDVIVKIHRNLVDLDE